MQDALRQATIYFHEFLAFFLAGLADGFAHVNAALGLLVALFAAWQLAQWGRLWAVALGATIFHLAAEVMLPVVAHDKPFHLPPDLLTVHYWKTALALYLGYLLVIGIFFGIKQALLPKLAPSH